MKNKNFKRIAIGSHFFRLLLTTVFVIAVFTAFAQNKVVTGVVKNPSGETLIGVSILEKGTTNGTITDFDGNFSLNVSNNATLVFSYVGFQPQEIYVANQSTLIGILS